MCRELDRNRESPVAWSVVETWTGTVKTPVEFWASTTWVGGATGYPPKVVTGEDNQYCRGENENNANGEMKIALTGTTWENGNQWIVGTAVSYKLDSINKWGSYRFTAQAGDNLTVDKLYVYVTEAGESPAYNYGLMNDNGDGYPDNSWIDNAIVTITSTGWVTVDLPTDPTLTAGNVYHIAIVPSGTPDTENYVGLRDVTSDYDYYPYYDETPQQENDTQIASTRFDGSVWSIIPADPAFTLAYVNSTYRGQPYHDSGFPSVYGSTYMGQSGLSVGENSLLTSVSFRARKMGSPPDKDNLYVYLNNVETNENISIGTFENTLFTPSLAWFTKATSIRLVAGQTYRLCFKSPFSDSSNYYQIQVSPTSDNAQCNSVTYFGTTSTRISSANSGSSWSAMNHQDLCFYFVFDSYKSSAFFESDVFDYGMTADWTAPYWNDNIPNGCSMKVYLRSGSDDSPYLDGTYAPDTENWSGWCLHDKNVENTSLPNNRYVQYRVEFYRGSDNSQTPKLFDITISSLFPG